MAFQWMRRVLTALAPAALLALSACGGGTIESQFHPTRVVAFGDAMSDLGNGGSEYTVNDGGNGIWVRLLAQDYGVALGTSASGGTDYAWGNARVIAKPDAAGNSATPTVKEQIDAFLSANGGAFAPGDLVALNAGTSDIIVNMQAYRAGQITSDQLIANVKQAGHDLAAQAMRLTAAGASHVVIVGVSDLKTTPWGVSTNQQDLLSTLTTDFNDAVLVDLEDQGQKMLFVDIALLTNVIAASPAAYGLVDSANPVCTSVDPGPGIGIGTNQVNSAKCTSSTIVSGAAYNVYMWADPVYPTPIVHARIADYVYARVHTRW